MEKGSIDTAPGFLPVLVVEDDDGLRELIVKSLTKAGFKAFGVSASGHAMESLLSGNDMLLLLDQKLPGMSGLEMLETLARQGVRVPFVIMTGHGDERLAVEMMKLGAEDYIVKDINFIDTLIGVLNRVCRKIDTERRLRASEAALRQSEEQYRLIYENAPIGITQFDRDSVITSCNRYVSDLMAIPPEKIVGVNILKTVQNEKQRSALNEALAGRIGFFEGEYGFIISKKKCFIKSIYAPMFDIHGQVSGGICITEDVTEQMHAQKEIEKHAQLLKKAQELSKIGTWELNMDTRRLLWTEENHKIFGIPLGTPLTYESFLNCVHPDDRGYVDMEWKAALAGEPYDIEHRIVCNGKVKWVREKAELEFAEDGQCIQGTGFTQDITENKFMASEREKLIAAVEQIAEGVMITNPEGRIEYVNPALEGMTGYTKEEIIGQNPRILKSGVQDMRFYASLWGAITQGRQWKGQMTNKRKDGSLYTEETAISPVMDKNGKIVNFVAIKRDITLELLAEERLRQTQKMESIGSLAGGIAHDFNNLLFPIMGMAELLLEDLPKEGLEYQNALEIFNAGKRGSELVKQILAFSRQTEHQMMPVRIQQVLKEAMKLSRATIPAEIEIRANLLQDCRPVWADPTQIHQIAMNLITNAFHAVESTRGKIEVRLWETLWQEERFSAMELKTGRYVVFSVSDTGCGIPPEIRDRIFEPYFTTKEKGKGTGLGLSMVHGIVRSLQGDIRVSSQVGHGSTFEIFLPILENVSASESAGPSAALPTGEERILLVDDEETITRLLKQALERLGYRVTAFTDSREALVTFRLVPGDFDLVITDMSMPKMTGDQLARELTAVRPDIPIILCTGFSERVNESNAKSLGIGGFLKKPVLALDLANMVRRLLDENSRPVQVK